jgi:hypothetical protein
MPTPNLKRRDMKECEVVCDPIRARGKAAFSARVARLIREGYSPVGGPVLAGKELILVMVKIP